MGSQDGCCTNMVSGGISYPFNIPFFCNWNLSSIIKQAITFPIYKRGCAKGMCNYIPISLLPIFSKVYEKLFLSRFLSFLDISNIISDNQFGFRQGKIPLDQQTNC